MASTSSIHLPSFLYPIPHYNPSFRIEKEIHQSVMIILSNRDGQAIRSSVRRRLLPSASCCAPCALACLPARPGRICCVLPAHLSIVPPSCLTLPMLCVHACLLPCLPCLPLPCKSLTCPCHACTMCTCLPCPCLPCLSCHLIPLTCLPSYTYLFTFIYFWRRKENRQLYFTPLHFWEDRDRMDWGLLSLTSLLCPEK